MRVVAIASAVVFLTAAAQTGRGAVTSLTTEPGVGTGMVRSKTSAAIPDADNCAFILLYFKSNISPTNPRSVENGSHS